MYETFLYGTESLFVHFTLEIKHGRQLNNVHFKIHYVYLVPLLRICALDCCLVPTVHLFQCFIHTIAFVFATLRAYSKCVHRI